MAGLEISTKQSALLARALVSWACHRWILGWDSVYLPELWAYIPVYEQALEIIHGRTS
jgi:hypothetical protein